MIWSAIKEQSKTNSQQTNFLKILHYLNCNELIIELSGKFEPNIKSELKDLLKARANASERPEIALVIQSLTTRVLEKTRKGSPFAPFLNSLSVLTGEVDPTLDLIIDEEIVYRRNKGQIEPLKVQSWSISNLVLEK